MAIGITRQIASGTHQQVQIPSGNYPWPTIRVLNPNDGVFYVKQNADVTNTGYGSWDYKVPSQSFGLLPGEGQGWQSVGLYYLDQSGSGANGEVSIYLTQQNVNEPIFQSIGRAIVSQTTSMDVVQGSQPANPGAGISRIWSDPSGSLNILMPNGTNKVVLDSTNFTPYVQGVALGGDLFGQISNGHVGIRYGSAIYYFDQGNAQRLWMQIASNSFNLYTQGGAFQFLSQAGALLASIDGSGNLIAANITTNTGAVFFIDTAHEIVNSGGNMIYFTGSGAHYFWGTSGVYATLQTGPINIQTGGLDIIAGGIQIPYNYEVSFGSPTNVRIIANTSNGLLFDTYNAPFYFRNSAAGYAQLLVIAPSQLNVNVGAAFAGSIAVQGAGVQAYAFYTPNSPTAAGQGYANAWINASSKDFKKNIIPIIDPLKILLNPDLRGVEYDHDWYLDAIDNVREERSGTYHHIGFVADDWLPHVPEIVAVDDAGKAEGMDYARVTTLLWEGIREYITKTDKRLDALEAK